MCRAIIIVSILFLRNWVVTVSCSISTLSRLLSALQLPLSAIFSLYALLLPQESFSLQDHSLMTSSCLRRLPIRLWCLLLRLNPSIFLCLRLMLVANCSVHANTVSLRPSACMSLPIVAIAFSFCAPIAPDYPITRAEALALNNFSFNKISLLHFTSFVVTR